VSFKNSIIIMTSNLGAGALLDAPEEGGADMRRGMVMAAVSGVLLTELSSSVSVYT
jgi:ATP-dependent Clp protease ATP-binding subunit ClpA